MHYPLLVIKPLGSFQGKYTVMPYVWVDIQTTGSVEPEPDEFARFAIITGQGQRHHEGFMV